MGLITYKDFRPTAFDVPGLNLSDRQDWLVCPCDHTRDSGALNESNWRVMLDLLGGESETLEIHRFGHWACGWFEIAIAHPSRAAHLADIVDRLDDYPVLDEMDWTELGHEMGETDA